MLLVVTGEVAVKKVHGKAVMAAITLSVLVFAFSMNAKADGSEYQRACAEVASMPVQTSEHDRLWKLFSVHWQHQMIEFPEWATSVGYPGQNGRWTDMSMEAIERRKKEIEYPYEALKGIDRNKLNATDQLNYDLFKYNLERALESRRFKGELLPVDQLEGPQQDCANVLVQNPTFTVKDYEDILARLDGMSAVIDQTIALMKAGVRAGITPPKITLRNVSEQIKAQVVEDPSKSALYEPFKTFPANISAIEKERLRKNAFRIISEKIVPAFQKFDRYFKDEYLPNCRESIAWRDLPDGEAWYQFRIQTNTTTNLTAKEIHEKGLAEVRRIRGDMEALMRESGFKGTFQEFSQHMRTAPQYFYDNASELLIGYRDIAKRIDPELMKQFGKLPRSQYGISPVPAFSEKSQPTAYYQPGSLTGGRAGVFYANTYNIKTRPKWEMEALSLHEAVPGHHLQVSLAQEMDSLPEFRKHGGYNAYVEGWGLYAESLGAELGMYKTMEGRYGQLTYDMWRAIRLVLDTGIHSMGWTRQQAIDFFKENSSKTEHDIEVETDRYIVWAGQALSYKIGQLTINDLKEQAKKELGDRFDVRAFHDTVLASGALPMDILKSQVRQWINKEKQLAER